MTKFYEIDYNEAGNMKKYDTDRSIGDMQLRLIKVALVLLFLCLLTACINYDEQVTLNSNGSGKIVMHYSVSQQLYSLISMGNQGSGEGKDEMPFKFKEDEIRADLQASGVTVEKVESKAEGDNQHFFVYAAFDKITDLNQTKTFREMQFEWNEDGNVVSIRRLLKGKENAAGSDPAQDQMAAAMLGNAKFVFQIQLPSKALPSPDTNGTIQADGQTVKWEYPLAQLGQGDKTMTAKFKKGGFLSGNLIFLAIGGGISLITLMLVIFMARKM